MHTHADNSLTVVIFWIAAVICIIAELALLRSAFTPHPSEAGMASHSSKGIEMLWAVLPAIILAVLLAATWKAVNH